jgi:hypothetical protein
MISMVEGLQTKLCIDVIPDSNIVRRGNSHSGVAELLTNQKISSTGVGV